jgi:hypothetical protein
VIENWIVVKIFASISTIRRGDKTATIRAPPFEKE